MNKLLLLVVMLCSGAVSFAQSDLTEQQVQEYQQIKDDIAGTYQIQMIGTRTLPTIQLSLFKTIQDARHQSEMVYITVSDNCKVMIPSQNEIDQANFQPLEYMTYINSNDQ